MQAKVTLEKQREKERSIALLKKKEQEALQGVLYCRDPVEFMCNYELLSVMSIHRWNSGRRKVHIKDQQLRAAKQRIQEPCFASAVLCAVVKRARGAWCLMADARCKS